MPFRIAAVVLVLFFFGHTFYGWDASWYGFWFGFGLLFSVFQLFSIVTCWHLATVDAKSWPAVAPIVWTLCASYVCVALLSWIYFFVGPAVFGATVAVLLGVGAWQKRPSVR